MSEKEVKEVKEGKVRKGKNCRKKIVLKIHIQMRLNQNQINETIRE